MALLFFVIPSAFADKGTFVDEIKFIQYLDENTALEEVRNGNLDIYYFRISSDRIDTAKARDGLQVFESTGGSYSILVNPLAGVETDDSQVQQEAMVLLRRSPGLTNTHAA